MCFNKFSLCLFISSNLENILFPNVKKWLEIILFSDTTNSDSKKLANFHSKQIPNFFANSSTSFSP